SRRRARSPPDTGWPAPPRAWGARPGAARRRLRAAEAPTSSLRSGDARAYGHIFRPLAGLLHIHRDKHPSRRFARNEESRGRSGRFRGSSSGGGLGLPDIQRPSRGRQTEAGEVDGHTTYGTAWMTTAEAERQLVVFSLHGEHYGLPITSVREIIRYVP